MFHQGVLVIISNPKVLIVSASILPKFIVPGMSFPSPLLVFVGTFVVVAAVYGLLQVGIAQRIAPWLGLHGLGSTAQWAAPSPGLKRRSLQRDVVQPMHCSAEYALLYLCTALGLAGSKPMPFDNSASCSEGA